MSRPVRSLFTISMLICGIALSFIESPLIAQIAQSFTDIFINLLKSLSLPLVFFTIVAALSRLQEEQALGFLGWRIFTYSGLTTLSAAGIALLIYVLVNPTEQIHVLGDNEAPAVEGSYGNFLLEAVPSSFVEPFLNGNAIGVLVLALLSSIALLRLDFPWKQTCIDGANALSQLFLKMAELLLILMPFAICAFALIFFRDLREGKWAQILWYVVCVLGANLIQGLIILPLFLKFKGISPWKLFRGVERALLVAFFSKSSSATLPITLNQAESYGLPKKVTRVALPLCTTVNMNGCAAFILITYLFVAEYNGYSFSPLELFSWVFIASVAAVGNAAVPMGCFFLASAFIASAGIPLAVLGMILPVYAFIDMVETALNVWSDTCITAVLTKDLENR